MKQAEAAVDFIGQDRPHAAQEWMDGLVQRVELLRELPEQGRIVPEWEEEGVREVFHGSYRILYEVLEDRIEILTLSHMRQVLPLD